MRIRRQSWALTVFAGLCFLFVSSLLIATAVNSVHGHMCYSIFTFYENTCGLKKSR